MFSRGVWSLGPAVLQNAVGIIGGYSNHLAAGGLQCIQQSSCGSSGDWFMESMTRSMICIDIIDIIAARYPTTWLTA